MKFGFVSLQLLCCPKRRQRRCGSEETVLPVGLATTVVAEDMQILAFVEASEISIGGWSRSVSVSPLSQHEGMFLHVISACRYQSSSSVIAIGFYFILFFMYIHYVHVSLRLAYGTPAPTPGRIQGPAWLIGLPRRSK